LQDLHSQIKSAAFLRPPLCYKSETCVCNILKWMLMLVERKICDFIELHLTHSIPIDLL